MTPNPKPNNPNLKKQTSDMSSSDPICVHIDCHSDTIEVDLKRLETLAVAICEQLEIIDVNVQISIVDDAGMIEVHRQFLDNNHTTDVISFDLSDEFEPSRNFQIVVNADMARRQAAKRGHPAESELALYITHGMLHNAGYDDVDDEQSRQMHEKEDEILQAHGFGIIYHKNETQD